MELDSKALFEGVRAKSHGGAWAQTLIREERGGKCLADFRILPPANVRWTTEDGLGKVEEVWASKVFGDRAGAELWLTSEPFSEIDRQQARAIKEP